MGLFQPYTYILSILFIELYKLFEIYLIIQQNIREVKKNKQCKF